MSGKTAPEIVEATKTTYSNVRRTCRILGLSIASADRTQQNNVRWGANEIANLKPYLTEELSVDKALELFPSRTHLAVSARLARLRKGSNRPTKEARPRRRWTAEDDELIRQHIVHKDQSSRDLAKKLERSEMATVKRIEVVRQEMTRAADNASISIQDFKDKEVSKDSLK